MLKFCYLPVHMHPIDVSSYIKSFSIYDPESMFGLWTKFNVIFEKKVPY